MAVTLAVGTAPVWVAQTGLSMAVHSAVHWDGLSVLSMDETMVERMDASKEAPMAVHSAAR